MYDQKILWVDDEPAQIAHLADYLQDSGFSIKIVRDAGACLDLLSAQMFDLVILDVMMPLPSEFESATTRSGFETGLTLARQIRSRYPQLYIVGCSVTSEPRIVSYFREFGSGYWRKTDLIPGRKFTEMVEHIFTGDPMPPKVFIVHGHNEKAKLELKNYIQNTLKLGEPIILHEQPSMGRTVIEKFEQEASDVDIVFVLLTPDDVGAPVTSDNNTKRRARQNVLFEMGYFYGKLQRTSGRVIGLYKGALELPSDIGGVIFVNIDNGIAAASEEIRRELVGYINN